MSIDEPTAVLALSEPTQAMVARPVNDIEILPIGYEVYPAALDEIGFPDDRALVRVEYCASIRWAVRHGRMAMNVDGQFDPESMQDRIDPDYLATHRFPLDVAMRMAAAWVRMRMGRLGYFRVEPDS